MRGYHVNKCDDKGGNTWFGNIGLEISKDKEIEMSCRLSYTKSWSYGSITMSVSFIETGTKNVLHDHAERSAKAVHLNNVFPNRIALFILH